MESRKLSWFGSVDLAISRVRAYELLGKFLGMFREQLDVHTTYDVTPLAEFTLEELLDLLEAMKPAIVGTVTVLDS